MELRMDGRVALVTGGSKGLGYAMAHKFASCGAAVSLLARTEEEVVRAAETIAEETGAKTLGLACDVSRADQIQAGYDSTIENFGKIDILVNNAGFAKAGRFETITDEEWQHDFDLKLMAAVRMSRLVLPGMKERRWGRIINMLNTLAKTPSRGSAPTSVTRAAGMALTKVLAGEGAAYNVLVNGFNIGLIKSDQIRRGYEASGKNVTFEEFLEEQGKKSVPLGRFGEAEECANLAALLCSDDCGFVSGTAINIDGNMSPAM
ncbi:MAG: SDR family oxidoreductase [Gammaproteobacteria bacterium]|jgi:3-oxoacyl-[acyl-carrier protein] reductase|nr:SDR family oxidoreductase [Gammaproteobacteria bacterium]MBT4494223.1 SDR family oxidoreductase [Gammaproteobacteria bacterium]MBT7371950.1 SDR family oxidoreductase [Gammaproteobacteria bacterium]